MSSTLTQPRPVFGLQEYLVLLLIRIRQAFQLSLLGLLHATRAVLLPVDQEGSLHIFVYPVARLVEETPWVMKKGCSSGCVRSMVSSGA